MMKKVILSVFVVLTVAFASLAQASETSAATNSAAATATEDQPLSAEITKAPATPESQIPLKLEKASVSQEQTSQTGKLFLTLFVLVGMGGAGVFLARKYAFSNKINKSNMQIKVLTQHHLGAKKSLAIIRVAGESILIGVTDQNISMIKSLSLIDDEVPAELPSQSFAATMSAGGGDQIVQSKEITELASEVEDDFSFAGIKTNVSQKLKSMRNFQ
ncbi:polar flagellar assembly protein FliO [Bdellovibrio sp. qaytius]|nr:polar flagellar assembly protein FliO [Bdellovibrio sp. qaytius]